MTAPLSLDLRRRLVRAAERGASIRGAARHFEVSPSAAIKLIDRVRRTGSLEPGRIGGHRKPALADHTDLIRAPVEAQPLITLAALQGRAQGVRRPARGARHLVDDAAPPRPVA